jgi:D-alanyl-lipoteichoic acid acyltransferase DltB (MBOAT superfamily)
MLLLAASYFFYMSWKIEYIILIIVSTLVDYFVAQRMEKIPDKRKRRPLLYLSLLVNLGILAFFKYANFLAFSFQDITGYEPTPIHNFLLPVGISFYTFQTLSYTIDVYHGKMKAEKHLGYFAVYVAYFPQLVAGPIERADRLLPQFQQPIKFEYSRVRSGLMLMFWGFFKKMVIADRVAEYVNKIYDNPEIYDGLSNLVATYFFAFQIFCDFSGYSDIAIGTSLIMGVDLMVNFRRPYFATSIQNHWQRWHISLSTWFRDYLYIPLGGNRVVKWRWWYNLLVTFVVSGLWHGANWTFVVWGGIHGILLVVGIWTQGFRENLYKVTGLDKMDRLRTAIQIFIVFHLVIIAWVFFRAESVGDAAIVLKKIATMNPLKTGKLMSSLASMGMVEVLLAVGSVFIMEAIHVFQERGNSVREWITSKPAVFRWSVYTIAVFAMLILAKFSSQEEFIYFQF